MTIDTVIFDIGNVLYHWDIEALYKSRIPDAAERRWFINNVVTAEWHFQHDAGRPLAPMVAELKAEYPDHGAMIDAYIDNWLETIPGPVPGMLRLVEALHRRNVPLFAITNFGTQFWDMFRPTAPVFDNFQDIVVSGTEKLLKPDRAIYELALKRFEIAPAQAIFIDDRMDNVEGARACGLTAHHFVDAPALQQELEDLGLL